MLSDIEERGPNTNEERRTQVNYTRKRRKKVRDSCTSSPTFSLSPRLRDGEGVQKKLKLAFVSQLPVAAILFCLTRL